MKSQSRNNDLHYLLSLTSTASSEETLAFWLYSNNFGSLPNEDNMSLNTQLFKDFSSANDGIKFSYKASFIGIVATNNEVLVNELYGSFLSKNWQLDLGLRHPETLWEGLSSSNGNILVSGNARSFPGYNLRLINYVPLPFAKKWLSIKGNYSDFFLNDKRFVDKTRLHSKSIYLKYKLGAKTELITGLNHYAQWGGNSEILGKQPSKFKDYLRIITGKSGGKNSLETDELNVLGNHLGQYLLQFNYLGDKQDWNLYYSHPFEDASGREMQNWQDGLYGLFIDFKNPSGLVSHFLAEFTYTKNMSGSNQPDDADGGRGRDDYFNNGVYRSGWTFFGNTIGSPYFTTKPVDENGITQGIVQGDNRFRAINFSVKGNLNNFKYKTLISHTTYFGWFGMEYEKKPIQFSGIVEIIIPRIQNFPIEISFATAFDTATYRPVNFGGFIKLTKNGIF